ncbi:GerAB/ArcD/ProY family transporter [Metabacillus rhizolycopersici]|uniref:GerAB/ArcD/ProY family transporter n=1 Tax=Metabacillus rhizolycopersici TaxID=2875709 RepID=UPI0027E20A7E|nr:endospore germination permease [Metabacillus rhizolycopersici]
MIGERGGAPRQWRKQKISTIQLFAMMFLFDLGTALVVDYGITAKKDAWLAILLGMGGGMVLFFIYYSLFRQYPSLPLTGYARKIFGKYLGWIIGLLYILYFLYIAARIVRDFGDLLLSSALSKTPLLAIIILFVLVICYLLYLGIEVLGRTAEVFIVILLLFGVAGNFFILVSGDVNLQNLQPFLENGWKPILTTAFPTIISFPFGQMLIFMMLLPYLNRPRLVKKVWLSALISSGLILCWTASLNIAVLGVEVTERATFPTLETLRKVNFLEFIQRLDAIVVFSMLITMLFKASILLYCALIGMVDLFKLNNYQSILLPSGVILIFFSMIIGSNYSEIREDGGDVLYYYLNIPLLIIIPLLMLLVVMIRNGFKKKGRSKLNET